MPIPLGVLASARVEPASSGVLTGTFLQSVWDSSDLTEYTHSSQNFGSAAADRYIVAAVSGRAYGQKSIVSVTIGGVTATEAAQAGVGGNTAGIYYAAVPSGASGDVVVTFDGGMVRCGVGLWSVTGGISEVADTAIDVSAGHGGDPSVTVTIPSGGFLVALTVGNSQPTVEWTNATEQYDEYIETAAHSGADSATPGIVTVTADVTGGQSTPLACAVFA